ncbi:MAG: hypothetical protein ACK5SX_12170 [Sandaracinobacter sp.]
MGLGYRRFRAIADAIGVRLVEGGAEPRAALLRIRGHSIAPADWATSRANGLAPAEHAIQVLPTTKGLFL